MPGGHWDYHNHRAAELIGEIGEDLYKRFPKLSQIHEDLSKVLGRVWNKLDYDFSSDSYIEDDEQFEKDFVEELGKIINKKCKLKIYEVEKDKE